MNKKYIPRILLIVGIVLLCLSVVLSCISAGSKNIIGGAGLPTLIFVFTHERGGIYSTLAFCGILSIVTSVILKLMKKQRSHTT